MEEEYAFVKVVGEKFSFKVLSRSIISQNGWLFFDRVNPKGEIIPMKAPHNNVAFVEIPNRPADKKENLDTPDEEV